MLFRGVVVLVVVCGRRAVESGVPSTSTAHVRAHAIWCKLTIELNWFFPRTTPKGTPQASVPTAARAPTAARGARLSRLAQRRQMSQPTAGVVVGLQQPLLADCTGTCTWHGACHDTTVGHAGVGGSKVSLADHEPAAPHSCRARNADQVLHCFAVPLLAKQHFSTQAWQARRCGAPCC